MAQGCRAMGELSVFLAAASSARTYAEEDAPEPAATPAFPDLVSATVTPDETIAAISTTQPTYIRVRMSDGTKENVDFYYYVNHSLPFEWKSSSKSAAYQAGALAVKSFGWYWMINGPHPGLTAIGVTDADVGAYPIAGQIYNDQDISSFGNSQLAVKGTSAQFLKDSNNNVYQGKHKVGAWEDDRDDTPNDTISQEGSRYLADQGLDRDTILTTYYASPTAASVVTITPREIRDLRVSSVTASSITLTWTGGLGTGGSTPYYVGKWNGSQYDYTVVTGTTWTDTNVQAGTFYYYNVWTENSVGFGRVSFADGYITASTLFAQRAAPPSYEVTYITNNQVRFTFNKTGATSYIVKKKVNGQWQTMQTSSSNVYKETGLSPNTRYEYTIAAQVSGAWTEYTNGGSFTIRTYLTRPGR